MAFSDAIELGASSGTAGVLSPARRRLMVPLAVRRQARTPVVPEEGVH
jgi:hypothetical protein